MESASGPTGLAGATEVTRFSPPKYWHHLLLCNQHALPLRKAPRKKVPHASKSCSFLRSPSSGNGGAVASAPRGTWSCRRFDGLQFQYRILIAKKRSQRRTAIARSQQPRPRRVLWRNCLYIASRCRNRRNQSGNGHHVQRGWRTQRCHGYQPV